MKSYINLLVTLKTLESPSFFYSVFKIERAAGHDFQAAAQRSFELIKCCGIYNRENWQAAEKRYLSISK